MPIRKQHKLPQRQGFGATLRINAECSKIVIVQPAAQIVAQRLAPLGKSLLGKFEGDEVEILVAGTRQQFAVTEVV